MLRTQNSEKTERKLKRPNQNNRFMNKCGWVEKYIERAIKF